MCWHYFLTHFWSWWHKFLAKFKCKNSGGWNRSFCFSVLDWRSRLRQVQTLATHAGGAAGSFFHCPPAIIKEERHHHGTRSEVLSSWKGHCHKWAISASCCCGQFGCWRNCRTQCLDKPALWSACHKSSHYGSGWITKDKAVGMEKSEILKMQPSTEQNKGILRVLVGKMWWTKCGGFGFEAPDKPYIFGTCFLWKSPSLAAKLYFFPIKWGFG